MNNPNALIKKWLSCILFIFLDAVLILLAMYLSVLFYYSGNIPPQQLAAFVRYSGFAAGIAVILLSLFGLYNHIWKYSLTISELIEIAIACFASAVGMIAASYFLLHTLLPWAIYTNFILFSTILISMLRLCPYLPKFVRNNLLKGGKTKRLLIVGAGSAGVMVIDYLRSDGYSYGKPVALVDDNSSKHGMKVHGVVVRGACSAIPEIVERFKIDEILLAIPSATLQERKRILGYAAEAKRRVTTLPPVEDIKVEGVSREMIRDLDLHELLARPEIQVNHAKSTMYIRGKTVLVTGGGGSIGSELCRQAAKCKPRKLVIFDVYENNAFDLYNELHAKYPDLDIQVRIGSVRDMIRMREIFEEFRPEIVFHAAAHKHVPLMEENPREAVKNNIFGTLNTAQCAVDYKAERFVLLSTDKAVNPTNIMGATKRVSELIMQHINKKSDFTKLAAVRFGNVLGSNGSVIPTFKKQIAQGGPVTVTHPDITRYFMTIPEAAQLVVQAGAIAKDGEIFVLDMGDPVRIDDLARNIIRLSGFTPDVDIKVEYTGLRPGEKLYEELYCMDENNTMTKTENNKIFVLQPTELDEEDFWNKIEQLRVECNNSQADIRGLLKALVPTFKEQKECNCTETKNTQ